MLRVHFEFVQENKDFSRSLFSTYSEFITIASNAGGYDLILALPMAKRLG